MIILYIAIGVALAPFILEAALWLLLVPLAWLGTALEACLPKRETPLEAASREYNELLRRERGE